MKAAEKWINQISEAVMASAFIGGSPRGIEVERVLKQIQADALTTAADQIIDDGNPELARKRILGIRDAL